MGDNMAIDEPSSVTEDRATRRRIKQRENRRRKREVARTANDDPVSDSNVISKLPEGIGNPSTTEMSQNSNPVQVSKNAGLKETKRFLINIYEWDVLEDDDTVLNIITSNFDGLRCSSTWLGVKLSWKRVSSMRFDNIHEMEALVEAREEEADICQMHALRVPELLDLIKHDGESDREAVRYGAVKLFVILPFLETQRVYLGVQLEIARRRNTEYRELRKLAFLDSIFTAMMVPTVKHFEQGYNERRDLARRLGVGEHRLDGSFLKHKVTDARQKLQEALGNARDEDWVDNKRLV